MLQAIKALLYSFAFARPNVRFSLKVLKAKNDKGNWTYAPSPKDSLVEVASKIVGQDSASACACHQICSDDIDDGIDSGWTVEALIASRSAGNVPSILLFPRLTMPDLSKIRNTSQYVSVDGRPMTSDRGTIKEIVKLYKQTLQASHESLESTSIPRPFLCLQIRCPPESYDVNVEPAKDEVLFFRPAGLLSILEKLFKEVYPVYERHEPDCQPTTEVLHDQISSSGPNHDTFQPTDHITTELQKAQQDDTRKSTLKGENLLSNLALSNPFTIAAMTSRVLPKKMNSPGTQASSPFVKRPPSQEHEDFYEMPASAAHSHRTPLGQDVQLPSPNTSSDNTDPYQNPGPPLRRRAPVSSKQRAGPGADILEPGHDFDSETPAEASFFKTWLTPQTQERRRSAFEAHTTRSSSGRSDEFEMLEQQPVSEVNDLFPTAINSTSALRWGPGAKAFRPPLKSSFKGQKPTRMVPPFPATPQGGFNHISSSTTSAVTDASQTRLSFSKPSTEISTQSSRRTQEILQEPSLADELPLSTELEEILDFEYRKKAAIAQHRRQSTKFPSRSINDILKSRAGEFTSTQAVHSDTAIAKPGGRPEGAVIEKEAFAAKFGDAHHAPRSTNEFSSHQNRYPAVAKDLSHSHPTLAKSSLIDSPSSLTTQIVGSPHTLTPLSAPSLPENDPRAYFIRQQDRGRTSKLYRTKSLKLPLETIPVDSMTLHLTQPVDAFRSLQTTQALVQYLSKHDQYIVDGHITYADLVESSLPVGWQDTLRELIKKSHGGRDDDNVEFSIAEVEISIPGHVR